MTLLEVKDLNISYQTDAGIFPAVRNVSFSIEKGKSLGIIGESGCGKTTIGMGILQLLPENAKIESGSIIFKGSDLVTFSEEKLCDIRGADISMIFQAAMNSLNPVQRVGDQIVEAIQIHDHNISKNDAITDVKRLFMEVGLSPERLNDFPHQYSGGMKQRAIIAMSMACEPSLVIADEPTTALDMVVQKQILIQLRKIQQERNVTVILISHDIGVVSEICHNLAVMFKGEILEYGTKEEILKKPVHPYTQMLMSSYLVFGKTIELPEFKRHNSVSSSTDSHSGNGYYHTCATADEKCKLTEPFWQEITKTHKVRCSPCS